MVVMAMRRQDEVKHNLALCIYGCLFYIIQHDLLIADRAMLAAVVIGGIACVDQGEMAVALQQDGIGIAGIQKMDPIRPGCFYRRLRCDGVALFIVVIQRDGQDIQQKNKGHQGDHKIGGDFFKHARNLNCSVENPISTVG